MLDYCHSPSPYYLDKFELQVETFGAMAKTEKIAFILEQVCDFSCFHLSFKSVLLRMTQLNVMSASVGSLVFRPPGLCTRTNTCEEDKS